MNIIFLKLKNLFKNLFKKLFKKTTTKNNITKAGDGPTLLAVRDIWAIEGCVSGQDPWEDTCLKCGKCGRFEKDA